ncbi:MAG: hypothetical protein R3Y36_06290, partial [Spirochaetales bacterium]
MSSRSLQKKMDKLLKAEEAGLLKSTTKSRFLRKLLANKLAVLGLAIFLIITLLCVFAPLFTQYSASKIDLVNRLSP